MKDPELPKSWIDPLRQHDAELAGLANRWEWETCRTWSESVFTAIADRTLINGWADESCIKEMRHDICLDSTRQMCRRQDYRPYNPPNNQQRHHRRSRSFSPKRARFSEKTHDRSSDRRTDRTNDREEDVQYKPVFDKEVEGTPCRSWNKGTDCGFEYSHGKLPDRSPHLCAYCARKYKKAYGHPEYKCRRKEKDIREAGNGRDSGQEQSRDHTKGF